MPAATFFHFNRFFVDIGNGVHNFSTHQLRLYLSNEAPSATADAVKADLAEIATGNGYSGPILLTTTSWGLTSGALPTKLILEDPPTLTATGGAIATFQYVVLYNDTPSSPLDPLIGCWAYTSPVSLQSGESFKIDLSQANGVLQFNKP